MLVCERAVVDTTNRLKPYIDIRKKVLPFNIGQGSVIEYV